MDGGVPREGIHRGLKAGQRLLTHPDEYRQIFGEDEAEPGVFRASRRHIIVEHNPAEFNPSVCHLPVVQTTTLGNTSLNKTKPEAYLNYCTTCPLIPSFRPGC
jgi:hypothetical protein